MATEILILATTIEVTSSRDVTMSDVKIKALFDKFTDGICFLVSGSNYCELKVRDTRYGTFI